MTLREFANLVAANKMSWGVDEWNAATPAERRREVKDWNDSEREEARAVKKAQARERRLVERGNAQQRAKVRALAKSRVRGGEDAFTRQGRMSTADWNATFHA